MFNNFFAPAFTPAFTSAFGNDFADMLRSIAGPINAAGSSVHAYRYSDETGETLVFDLPGCKKEDLDLSVQGRKFIVKGKRVVGSTEMSYETEASTSYDVEHAKYAYADGVLTIKIPAYQKTEPEVKKITLE